MVASLLWAGGSTLSTNTNPMTVGTYPAATYGTNPFMAQAFAGHAPAPNAGSVVETGRWGSSLYVPSPHYRTNSTINAVDGSGNATHFVSVNAGFEDEGHVNYLDSGGNATWGGDAWDHVCGLAFILAIDDVLLDGLGVVHPSVDGQAFASGSAQSIVAYSLFGFGVTTWAVHSVSGVISNGSGLFGAVLPVRTNLDREVSPFAIALVQGHSTDTPPYSTPDLVNSLPSWSMIGFQQVTNYFVAAALWVPANPSSPDYSFSFSGFPTSDYGNMIISTLNFPPAPPSHPFAAMIG